MRNVAFVATGKKEYNGDRYPTRYYGANEFGMLVQISKEEYDEWDKETEIDITFYERNVYYKSKKLKKEV